MKLKKCPKCGSGNIVRRKNYPERPDGTFYDVCRDCMAIWESIPEGEQYKRAGTELVNQLADTILSAMHLATARVPDNG